MWTMGEKRRYFPLADHAKNREIKPIEIIADKNKRGKAGLEPFMNFIPRTEKVMNGSAHRPVWVHAEGVSDRVSERCER